MSVMAYCFAFHYHPKQWTMKLVDNLMEAGDQWYVSVISTFSSCLLLSCTKLSLVSMLVLSVDQFIFKLKLVGLYLIFQVLATARKTA